MCGIGFKCGGRDGSVFVVRREMCRGTDDCVCMCGGVAVWMYVCRDLVLCV